MMNTEYTSKCLIVRVLLLTLISFIVVTLFAFVMSKTIDAGSELIWLHIIIDTLVLIVTVAGVYVAYKIQMSIVKLTADNRKRDMFDKNLQILIKKIEAINITYQSWCLQTDEQVKRAYANTLSTQSMVVYYALKDLTSSNYYKEHWADKPMNTDEMFNILQTLSDKFIIRIVGVKEKDEKGVKDTDLTQSSTFAHINNLNNYTADFIRNIYQVLYSDTHLLEERFV